MGDNLLTPLSNIRREAVRRTQRFVGLTNGRLVYTVTFENNSQLSQDGNLPL